MSDSFSTKGYEYLELSTQIIIAAALKRGVKVDVIDKQTGLLRFSKKNKVEYIQEGGRTSKESHIVPFIMVNKLASKILLKEHGINVPKGRDYDNFKSASKDYSYFSKKKCVIKPKASDCGRGISILESGFTKSIFEKSLKLAFQFDSSILIEEFFEGMEYRFLIIDGKNIGVACRVPANVIGDGKHSIEELVKIKNSDPRRREWCKGPLEYLHLDEVEKQVLKEQSLTINSIPSKGKQIFIRHNSNMATGGDSLDYTDKVDKSYKQVAIKAAKAMNAKICGVDMMIKDFKKPATKNNYAIVEVNDIPGLVMHTFPYEGKNRDPGKYIVELLGF